MVTKYDRLGFVMGEKIYVVWSRRSNSIFGAYSKVDTAEKVLDLVDGTVMFPIEVDSNLTVLGNIESGLKRYLVKVGTEGKIEQVVPIPNDSDMEIEKKETILSNGKTEKEIYVWAASPSEAKLKSGE